MGIKRNVPKSPEHDPGRRDPIDRLTTAAGLAIVVVLIQAGVGWVMWRYVGADWAQRGQIGDMFGVVNALFSGLAFAGVIYAILLQRKELQLQRQELELTRHELERSAEAQEHSAMLLKKQLDLSYAEADTRSRPVIRASLASATLGGIMFYLKNVGAPMMNLEVSPLGEFEVSTENSEADSGEGFSIALQSPSKLPVEVDVSVTFTDAIRRRRRLVLRLNTDHIPASRVVFEGAEHDVPPMSH